MTSFSSSNVFFTPPFQADSYSEIGTERAPEAIMEAEKVNQLSISQQPHTPSPQTFMTADGGLSQDLHSWFQAGDAPPEFASEISFDYDWDNSHNFSSHNNLLPTEQQAAVSTSAHTSGGATEK